MGQPGPQVRKRHVRQVADPAITGEGHQVAQVTHVCPLGVRGLTTLDNTMSGEGLNVAVGVFVHDLTLTKPGAIGKDIGAGALRVLAVSCRAGWR